MEVYAVEEYLKFIGSKVRNYRRAKFSNYLDFCNFHSINRVTMNRIETGQEFKMSSLIRVLKALDVQLEDFFNGMEYDMLEEQLNE